MNEPLTKSPSNQETGRKQQTPITAYRILQDARVRKEPLTRTVDYFDKESEDIFFRLTEYGEKVWKAMTTRTTTEPRRL